MFVGREKEIKILEKRVQSKGFEFGLVYGRRRIGKTRLLQEIVSKFDAIYYVANEMGLEYNLKQLSATITSYYNESFVFENFDQVFQYLAKRSHEKRTIFILDEFTYLMSSNKELLSVFQNAVDQHLLNSNLKMILSGSQVGMVEDAISYKKPLYGRTTFKMKLEPFDYYDAAKFYPNCTATEKVCLYSVFGGVPFYTSRIDDSKSVKENILDLIIEPGSIFEDEIAFFLSQEVRSVATYGKIMNAIASGATKLSEISTKSGSTNTGTTSKYLDLLLSLGIVEKEFCFGESNKSKKTIYRIQDQLFRFHFSFIEKNKSKKVIMDPENFYNTMVQPHLEEYVSNEFENICRDFLKRKYENTIQEIGRYWFNDAAKRQDIEIDIVMKTNHQLHVYECKWTNSRIGMGIVNNLQTKVDHFEGAQLGFFSKKGYHSELSDKGYALYQVDDLYNVSNNELEHNRES
ncbi:ATP-binding protein [Alkalibacter rhizosphaerae]|uniref:ATP-binding protein n=1 Tax=Alkalibacter rhizosphaerae TaxID=2815577 RepID=A0A975AH67_9FIRM|nr:ATP-binding protein [Alkalibacter rhizosphaerae]QSX07688.1 ATP-binding protein [Alkalibacter rhizosphaerae]